MCDRDEAFLLLDEQLVETGWGIGGEENGPLIRAMALVTGWC
jgi:hypothetical protein